MAEGNAQSSFERRGARNAEMRDSGKERVMCHAAHTDKLKAQSLRRNYIDLQSHRHRHAVCLRMHELNRRGMMRRWIEKRKGERNKKGRRKVMEK